MGAFLLQNDPNFTSGKFFAFLLYANMFYEPVRQLVSINNLIAAGKASGERVFEILDTPVEINDSKASLSFPNNFSKITFQNVSFTYEGNKQIVITQNGELYGIHCSMILVNFNEFKVFQ